MLLLTKCQPVFRDEHLISSIEVVESCQHVSQVLGGLPWISATREEAGAGVKYFVDQGNFPHIRIVTENLLYQARTETQDGGLDIGGENLADVIGLGTEQEDLGMTT